MCFCEGFALFGMSYRLSISRSGNYYKCLAKKLQNIPNREISLAPRRILADNFPNGKLDES